MTPDRIISIQPPKKKKRQPITYTAEDIRLQGIEIDPGWSLRVEFGDNGDLPKQVFISPEKWEFSDFIRGEQDEVLDFRAVSPEGQAFTKVELEAFEVAPPPLPEIPEVEVPVIEALRLIFPESFLPEASFGFTEEEIPGMVFEQTGIFARERPAEFLTQLVAKGRTPEVETLISTFFDVQPTDIDRLFAEVLPEVTDEELIYRDYIRTGGQLDVASWREAGTPIRPEFEREVAEVRAKPRATKFLENQWGGWLVKEVSGGLNKDYILVTNADIETYILDNPATWEQIETWQRNHPALTLMDEVGILGGSLVMLPQQWGAAILQATQGFGGASVVEKDWADRLIEDADKRMNEFVSEVALKYKDAPSLLGISPTDVASVSRNIAYSLTSMVAGIAVGVPVAVVTAPIPGSRVAAWTAGTAASGAVAYQMTTYQITQTYLEFKDEEKRARTGDGLTQQEEDQLKEDFANLAMKYGLWEAIPEALSNLAFARILTTPLTKMIGRSLAGKVIFKVSGLYGEEFLTETITQKGQSAIEVEAGLREGRITWWEAFKEIAPQTFLLTTILGGLGQVSVASVNRIKASFKNEVGEGHPLFTEINDNITEDIIPTSMEPELSLPAEVISAIKARVREAVEFAKAEPEAGFVRIPGEKPEEITRIEPTFENLAEGQTLVDEAGDRWTITGIKKEGVPGKWAYTIKGETIELTRTRPLTDIERHYKIEQPPVTPTEVTPEVVGMTIDERAGGFEAIVTSDKGVGVKVGGLQKTAEEARASATRILSENLELLEKDWAPQGHTFQKAAASIKPTVTPTELARPEPGMPEAGIQPTMLPEEVAAKEVRPKGKGKVVQISMEDQLKLQQARQVEADIVPEPVPEGMKEAQEVQQEVGGLEELHKQDPVAQKRIFIGKDKKGRDQFRGLDFFISLKEQNFPETFTLKQAQMLFPSADFSRFTQPGTPQFNKVPRDAALDDMATEFGMTADEIADRVMAIRQEKRRIKELNAEIKEKATETPLTPRTDLTTTEVTENWETTGQPKLTFKQALSLSGFFGDYVLAEDTFTAFELQRELWSRTKAEQAQDFKARMDDLMVSQGLGVEEAWKQAARETSPGELPRLRTDFFEGMSAELRAALFSVVYHNKELQNYPFEMMSTLTALTNALAGNAIPRKRGRPSVGSATYVLYGPEGASAWDRLNFVFGKKPKVLKAIEKMTEEKHSLKDVVEAVFHETGREPIPLDKEMVDYLNTLTGIPFGYKTTFEPGFKYPIVKDLRDPADLQFARAELELGRQFAEGKLTFDEFELARREARDEAYPLPSVTKQEAPIEDAFKEIPLWPVPVRDNVVKVLKEMGMLPVDIGNFLRANKASFDFSFWRQQAPLIASHPVAFAQANVEAWNAIWSQKSTEASWERITRDPLYQIYEFVAEEGGDFLRPIHLTKGTAQWRGTEEFGYLTGERLIPRVTARLPWVKLSARAFETGTNVHNWLIFKNYYKVMLKYSEQIASGEKKLKAGEAFDMQKEMTDFAKSLANFSARGSLGKFAATAPELSALFFAPRAAVGRILSVKDLINANPRVRREAWKNATLFVSTLGGMILLGAAMGWWDVEKDPRNAEYMSIRIGNTRIDPWGGFRQFLVFFVRAYTKTGVSSVTGAEYTVDPIGLLQTFIRGKASPLMSTILDFWRGKNFVGEEVDIANKEQWAERVAPFSLWDIYETYKDDPTTALLVTIPAMVGAGVQTYTGDWKENYPKLGLPKYSENLTYGLTEPYYDTADFWSDTSSQFKGVDPETLTVAKGFPPFIKAIAEARVISEHLATLPSQRLVSLNADPAKGTTFSQYRQMWLDREVIVASGDKEKLKEFDQDERTRNADRGNFTQRQFALLNQYWAITDKKKQAEFLEEHKAEIGVKPRDKWLRSHPKENAELALWGQAKVLTREAYDHFKTLAKKYDIPDNAIPELLLPPVTSIDTHFTYEEMVSEGTHSSVEAKLLLLKDHLEAQEAGVKAYVDWRNESGQPLKLPDKPLTYYQLMVDNRPNLADLEEAQEANDEEEVEAIRARKVKDETFLDVERRIEAIGKGTRAAPVPDELVDAWVERGKVTDEFGAGSPEAKVWLIDNPEVHQWALSKGMLTDEGADWNEDVLRLNVELSGLEEGSEQYQVVKRKIQGHSEGFTQIDDFVSYYDIPVKGFRQERYLLENPVFAQEMKDIKGIEPPDYVPPIEYDELIEQETRTPEEELKVKAYEKKVPEEHIAGYVSYYSIGKPDNYEDVNKTTLWYEDDWFLMENLEFYNQVYKKLLGNQKMDFSKVPSREVFDKYLDYLQIDARQTKARADFRWDNLALDDWGVSAGIWTTSIVEQRRRAALTAGERVALSIEELEERLREVPAEPPPITILP